MKFNLTFLRSTSLMVIVLLLLLNGTGRAQDWQWETRLDVSFVRDDNVFESLIDQQNDNLIQLLLESQGHGLLFKRLFLSLNYQGGMEAYTRFREENRILNDLSWTVSSKLIDGLSLGTAVQIRDKRFFHASRGYGFYRFSPFLKYKLTHGLSAILYTHLYKLDRTEGTNFDHRYHSGSFSLEFIPNPKIHWEIQATLGQFRFQRAAFDYLSIGSNTYEWIDKGELQLDRQIEFALAMEVYQWAYLRIRFSYGRILSNSYGYSHYTPRIEIVGAKGLIWKTTLRLYWTLFRKIYTDPLQPIIQVHPDTETDENQLMLADLSKDFLETVSLWIRFAWYRNESPFRNLYYEKVRLSMGMSTRL